MSLGPEAAILACIQAQATDVLPALEGSYAGATAGGVVGILAMVLQDLMTRGPREQAELDRLRALFDDKGADRDTLNGKLLSAFAEADTERRRAILDHLVETTAAARLDAPQLG